jgi:hypothetical protein
MRAHSTRILSLALALAIAAGVGAFSIERTRLAFLDHEVQTLQERVRELSYNTASGGGVNLKMMPDPVTGKPTVPLEEVFSFDRHYAFCRVDTNPRGFLLHTYRLGDIVVKPHAFFMAMVATSVDQYAVTTRRDGKRQVVMRGGLSCATEVGQANVTLGSRAVAEHATYLIEAVDGGVGGGTAGDRFAFTAFFDPKDAPMNYSIFGPKATFTGRMVTGEITIIDVHVP